MPARSTPIVAIGVATPEVSGWMANSAFSLAEKMLSAPKVAPSRPAARMPMRQPGSLLRFIFSNDRIPRWFAAIGHDLFLSYVVSLRRKYGARMVSCQGFPRNFWKPSRTRIRKQPLPVLSGGSNGEIDVFARGSHAGALPQEGSQSKHRPSSRVRRVRETFFNAKALPILLWSC